MFFKSKALFGAAVLVSLIATTPAQAACWSADQISAAKVREFETVLMVSALRCRGGGVLASYNTFVRGSRPALTEANDQLRAHFDADGSGLNGYDRYVTSLANRYGAGGGFDCNEAADMLRSALASGGSLSSLERLADRARIDAPDGGRRCPVTMARAR
jgi:hypothetical protein